jgi:hypothetical protein
MMEMVGSRVSQVKARLFGRYGTAGDRRLARCVAGRIMGAMAVSLLASGSAFGQFVIQPLKLVVPVPPSKRVPVELMVENTTPNMTHTVSLSLADITQDANGIWQAIGPDAKIENGPDGKPKWATIDWEGLHPMRLDISNLRSCQSWLRLMQSQVEVRPSHRVPIQLFLDVPSGTRGYYCAALLARADLQAADVGGYTSNVQLEFVVPIIVQIQGRPEPQRVELTDVGLEFRPADEDGPAASLVSLDIKNSGGTYSLLKGIARIWQKFGGHWRKLTDVEFSKEISIIPGVEFRLKTDVGIPLGAGEYRVQGYLYVDGRQGADITKELQFPGDPRVRNTAPQAALDLDPRELIIDTVPGQTHMSTVLIANASEEPVTITVAAGLPDHMVNAAAGEIRGDQFQCTDWLEISPTQFTLQGYQRFNLRVLSKMPASATGANYYASVRFSAQHADGSEAGKTDCRVCVRNKAAQDNVLVNAFPVKFAELSPSRYLVTARFLNYGGTHIQPSCRAVLTSVGTNELIRKLNLSSDILNQSGVLLPLEARDFTGILDVAGVPPGRYRLTVQLTHDKGDPVERQEGLEVVATPGGRAIRTVDINQIGGKVTIKM